MSHLVQDTQPSSFPVSSGRPFSLATKWSCPFCRVCGNREGLKGAKCKLSKELVEPEETCRQNNFPLRILHESLILDPLFLLSTLGPCGCIRVAALVNKWPQFTHDTCWVLHSILPLTYAPGFTSGRGMDRENLGLGVGRLRGPGAFRVPSEHRFPSSPWERVPWAPRSGGVRLTLQLAVRVACLPPSNVGPHVRGLLGERVTWAWPWPGRHLCGLAAALPTSHSPVVQAQGGRGHTSPGAKRFRLELVPTWSGVQPTWASVPPSLSPQNPRVGCREAGVLSSLNIQEPGPAFSLFMPLGKLCIFKASTSQVGQMLIQ